MPKYINAALTFALTTSVASASGTIGYGSRAGMEVDVVSMSGLDSSKAVIRTKHSRENAISYCRDYVLKVTEDCVRQELAVRLNDVVTANCKTGVFTDFTGDRHRFIGPNPQSDVMAKYAVVDLATNRLEDGSMASGYPVFMGIFKALCPRGAPADY